MRICKIYFVKPIITNETRTNANTTNIFSKRWNWKQNMIALSSTEASKEDWLNSFCLTFWFKYLSSMGESVRSQLISQKHYLHSIFLSFGSIIFYWNQSAWFYLISFHSYLNKKNLSFGSKHIHNANKFI